MGSRPRNRKRNRSAPKKAIPQKKANDPHRLKLFAVISLAYIACVAVLALIFGVTASAFLATPVWAFLYLLFSSDGKVEHEGILNVFKSLRLPKLNYVNILCVAGTILIVQAVCGFLWGHYLDNTGLSSEMPEDFAGVLDVIVGDSRSAFVIVLSIGLSYLVGGYVAGVIPNRKCPAPYRHAIFGAIVYNCFSLSITLPLVMLSGYEEELPTTTEFLVILLLTVPAYLITVLGTRIAVGPARDPTHQLGTHVQAEGANGRWPKTRAFVTRFIPVRTAVTATVAVSLLTVVSILGWRHYKSNRVVRCDNPPVTAMLNYWPVTYAAEATTCHDLPSIDARLIESEHYSQSREQWERGLLTSVGSEFYVLIYINNGAVDNAEVVNPGRGVARNVRLTTEVPLGVANAHYIRVSFRGDNTNTVVGRFKITAEPHGRLEVIPRSGEIYNSNGTQLLRNDLEFANTTTLIGDFEPRWDASQFVRFRVKVVE